MSFPEPDRGEIRRFVKLVYRRATRGTFVALRTFREDIKEPWRPELWSMHELTGDLARLADAAGDLAWAAASTPEKALFAGPLATFKSRANAAQKNLAEGLAISIELDRAPERARERCEDLLGPASLVIKSGGLWADPVTGTVEPRLHLHWILSKPARDFAELVRLEEIRRRLAKLIDGDPSGAPVNHPYRWPGTWHRKSDAVLAQISSKAPSSWKRSK